MCLCLAKTIPQHTFLLVLFTNSQFFLLGRALATYFTENRSLLFFKRKRKVHGQQYLGRPAISLPTRTSDLSFWSLGHREELSGNLYENNEGQLQCYWVITQGGEAFQLFLLPHWKLAANWSLRIPTAKRRSPKVREKHRRVNCSFLWVGRFLMGLPCSSTPPDHTFHWDYLRS